MTSARRPPTADPPGLPEPWDRQPGEPDEAFLAFQVYRDLLGERSVGAVAATLDKRPQVVGRLAARFGWVTRAACWDQAEDDREARARDAKRDRLLRRVARLAREAADLLAAPDG